MSELQRTPLFEVHKSSGARIVPFAGWEMPVQYSGILEESRAVRTACGVFDISHMGRVWFTGADSCTFLQSLTSNDVSALTPGKAQYSLLTNDDGGIIDDIIVYRIEEEKFLVVINAGNAAKDIAWFKLHLSGDVVMTDRSGETAMIAVQGPAAPELVARLAGAHLLSLGRFTYATGTISGADAVFCRTGYTGEDGFEIVVPAENATALWTALVEAGAVPCGLGARDALRIEAGLPLYGHEIDDATSPVEALLMWAVKLDKGDFSGSAHIAKIKADGAVRKLVGIVLKERIIPRQGYNLVVDGELVGTVTSGVFSAARNAGIGMAYISTPHAAAGTIVEVEIRNNRYPVEVVPKKSLLLR